MTRSKGGSGSRTGNRNKKVGNAIGGQEGGDAKRAPTLHTCVLPTNWESQA